MNLLCEPLHCGSFTLPSPGWNINICCWTFFPQPGRWPSISKALTCTLSTIWMSCFLSCWFFLYLYDSKTLKFPEFWLLHTLTSVAKYRQCGYTTPAGAAWNPCVNLRTASPPRKLVTHIPLQKAIIAYLGIPEAMHLAVQKMQQQDIYTQYKQSTKKIENVISACPLQDYFYLLLVFWRRLEDQFLLAFLVFFRAQW